MKISEFPSAVIKENVDYTVKEITNVIKKYGPRESGNDACYDAEKHLKKSLISFRMKLILRNTKWLRKHFAFHKNRVFRYNGGGCYLPCFGVHECYFIYDRSVHCGRFGCNRPFHHGYGISYV